MSKHSPGPWRVDWGHVKDLDSTVIADLWDRSEPPRPLSGERLAANARLIAAAPEMLALLREALAKLYPVGTSSSDPPDVAVRIQRLLWQLEG